MCSLGNVEHPPQSIHYPSEARRGQRHLCDPGLSFVNAAYAAFEAAEDPGGADELVLNGSGAEAIPLPVAVELARRSRIDIASFPKNVSGVPLAVLEPYIICKDDKLFVVCITLSGSG